MEALWIWRQFPRQIASDLRPRGLHIKDWLRGTRGPDGDLVLSSYELLEILEFLPDESAFKTDAERGGRWPIDRQMRAEQVNESYRMRASFHAVHGGEDATFDPTDFEFIDPVARAEREKADKAKAKSIQQSQSSFEEAMGFS